MRQWLIPFRRLGGGNKKSLDLLVLPSFASLGSSVGGLQFANGHLTLMITLNSNVGAAAIQAFLRGIVFSTKGKGLSTPTRTLQATLEQIGTPTSTATQTINVRKKA